MMATDARLDRRRKSLEIWQAQAGTEESPARTRHRILQAGE